MYVLIVFNPGSTKDPVTGGFSSMEDIINELTEVEYTKLKTKVPLAYILYNGYIKIIESTGEATEQGKYFMFKAQENAKARAREDLLKELEEKKCEKKDLTV